MRLEDKIESFNKLADILKSGDSEVFALAKQKAMHSNSWFTEENVDFAVSNIIKMIDGDNLENWLKPYSIPQNQNSKKIGVVLAGNIPLVGFHDFLCVLMSGHSFLGKLSHNDLYLLPALAEILVSIDERFSNQIYFTTERLQNFEAVIATGSDNTSSYFESYFGKYPHIIRKNRNGVAFLNGEETKTDFEHLKQDVFAYFGMGCRSVSMLLVPEKYDFQTLLEVFESQTKLINHSKYFHNYEYNKAIYLVNQEPHYDNGCVLLKESELFGSPVSVLHYKHYKNRAEGLELLRNNQDKIQCIVSKDTFVSGSFGFGKAQNPELHDYADNVDTMKFLIDLMSK